MSFYNTTNLKGQDLFEAIMQANSQEEFVLNMLKKKRRMTASELYKHYPKPAPITSIRRALSNLKKKGLVRKTGQTKKGIYGKPEYVYEIAE